MSDLLQWTTVFRAGGAMTPIAEEEVRRLLGVDPTAAWRAFIDGYTPALLACIERAGVVDRDEAMEIYVRVCERLATNDYAALRRPDTSTGSFNGWLAVIVRRAAVDWIRSRVGRRRLFACVQNLDAFDQRLFELYYWQGRRPAEAAERLSVEMRRHVSLDRVFEGLERIDEVLTARHRAELLALTARARPAVPLEGGDDGAIDPPADQPDPEMELRRRERDAELSRALSSLPAEDAVIVSLKFVEGMTRAQIQQFLRLPELTEHRVRTIVARLRATLSAARVPVPTGSAETPGPMRTGAADV